MEYSVIIKSAASGVLLSDGHHCIMLLLSTGVSFAFGMLVDVEQFGMAQCPMTSTLTTEFWSTCFVHGNLQR